MKATLDHGRVPGKGNGQDEAQVRRWDSWHRPTAHAILTARECHQHTSDQHLIALTFNEIRRLPN